MPQTQANPRDSPPGENSGITGPPVNLRARKSLRDQLTKWHLQPTQRRVDGAHTPQHRAYVILRSKRFVGDPADPWRTGEQQANRINMGEAADTADASLIQAPGAIALSLKVSRH